MDTKFLGPEHKKFHFLMIMFVLFISCTLFMLDVALKDMIAFLIGEFILALIVFGSWYIYFRVTLKSGGFNENAYSFIIKESAIESIVKRYDKTIKRVVCVDNINKIKYERDVGGTGSRVLIWPNNYEILKESGFEFDDNVLEYYKKHKLPIVLYPPALSRKERKILKEAIEEFKRINEIG